MPSCERVDISCRGNQCGRLCGRSPNHELIGQRGPHYSFTSEFGSEKLTIRRILPFIEKRLVHTETFNRGRVSGNKFLLINAGGGDWLKTVHRAEGQAHSFWL
jgi:hypothetical protein